MGLLIQANGVRARVFTGCWWLRWADGMALGSWIFCAERSPSSYLLGHEHFHCLRYKAVGFWRFLWRYATDRRFRRNEEEMAHDFGLQVMHRDPYLAAAKRLGWTPGPR